MSTSLCARRAHQVNSKVAPGARWQSNNSSNAGPSSPPRPRSRSRDGRSTIKLDQVDLVGPPDPVSNIRPMFYAPVPSSSTTTTTSFASNSLLSSPSLPHPYSLSEFSQVTTRGGKGSSRGAGLGIFKSYRDHLDRVSNKVEEAEMKLRVSKLGTDNITQRFWKDNNSRFTRDLESWREQSQRRISALPDGVLGVGNEAIANISTITTTTSVANKSIEAANELSRDESAFYANWLQANGRRNRAYNVLVWRQAWDQVRLDAKVVLLRNWLKALVYMRGR